MIVMIFVNIALEHKQIRFWLLARVHSLVGVPGVPSVIDVLGILSGLVYPFLLSRENKQLSFLISC